MAELYQQSRVCSHARWYIEGSQRKQLIQGWMLSNDQTVVADCSRDIAPLMRSSARKR